MAPPRRQTDDTEDDYRKLRGGAGPINGHTRWVVRIVSAGIITALGWLLVNDRSSFERRQIAVEAHVVAVESLTRTTQAAQQAHEARAVGEWANISRRLDEIRDDLKEVKKRQ